MNPSLLQKSEKIKISDFSMLGDLARLMSIREVARHMRTTPAQISRRLKVVEKTLGFRIFERGPKGLIVTGAGQEALKLALLVMGEFQAILGNRRNRKASLDRPLGIASTSFLLSYAAIPALSEMIKVLSDVRSYVMSFNPDDLMAAGVKGAFQMAIHPTAFDWPRSWQTELVGHLRWSLFARKGHPFLRSREALEEVPFVYPMVWDGAKLTVQSDYCPLPVNQRNSFVGTQTAEQAMHLVRQSNVVGFLPELLMSDALEQGQVVEIDMPSWPVTEQAVYLSIRTDAVLESHYRVFSAALRRILN